MTPPLACTIVANNYLAYARSFTRSFLDRHPEGEVHVLVADKPQPGHDYGQEPFRVTFADELGIPRFRNFAFRYSILEMSTAVKPYYLLHLRRTLGCQRICYFDPDILVLGDLAPLYERLGEVDAILTPHLTAPLEDSAIPSQREILISGIYNLGFLGVAFNERTLPFLEWWSRRLYHDCIHDVAHGLFVDQRWMDFAPAFLSPIEILRDPGYNVAYWNLAHRRISEGKEGWMVDGVPLRFFHFSGYDVQRPELISRFQNRFTFVDRPELQPLFRIYAASIEREGHNETRGFPYQYGFFENGVPVSDLARLALRKVDPDAKRWPDPFSTSQPGSFLEWLRQPADDNDAMPLPRLAHILWDSKEDLRHIFPRPWEADRVAFARWFVGSTGAPEHVHPIFTEELRRALDRMGVGEGGDSRLGVKGLSLLLDPSISNAEQELSTQEIEWLTADAGMEPRRGPRVTRLAMEIHRRRWDLQRSFPDPLGADREAMALWFATSGRSEYRLPKSLVRPVLRSLSLRRRVWARLWWERQRMRQRRASATARESIILPAPGNGTEAPETTEPKASQATRPYGLNVIGWAAAPSGVGEACRGTLGALEIAKIPYFLWSLDGPADGALVDGVRSGLPYEISLYHVNADMMETIQRHLPRALTQGRHRIGYWFWELSHFPLLFADAFRHVDEVWAPTRFCQEAFRPLSPVDVRWVPPAVEPTVAFPAEREALGIDPDAFLFFFPFDALSVPERKNPLGLLRAFALVARGTRRPVHLLLKINHAESEPTYVANLRSMADLLPVTLMTGTLSRQEVNSLLAACDASVSLHRSEGLGLPLIESMYLGKPVVATGYGGVTDFLSDETGLVVAHKLVPIPKAEGPYPRGAIWAEPDLEHAAALMLSLVDDPQSVASRVEAARRTVRALYSPDAAGERFRRELLRIIESKGGHPAIPSTVGVGEIPDSARSRNLTVPSQSL